VRGNKAAKGALLWEWALRRARALPPLRLACAVRRLGQGSGGCVCLGVRVRPAAPHRACAEEYQDRPASTPRAPPSLPGRAHGTPPVTTARARAPQGQRRGAGRVHAQRAAPLRRDL